MKDELTIKKQGDKVEIDGVTYVREEPKYDRQLCLQGKWRAEIGKPAYVIKPGKGDAIEFSDTHYGEMTWPTRELAEEYILIAKGEWLAKKGDDVYVYREGYSEMQDVWKNTDADWPFREGRYLFPSESQRSTYIASQRRLPTVDSLKQAYAQFTLGGSLGFLQVLQPEFKNYLEAACKSRFIANAIREKEEKRSDDVRYYVHADTWRGITWSTLRQLPIGAEYFSTEQGAKLYLETMGDSIQHLTS